MPSYYSVIQFTPDPATDERINIGVVAFDEQATSVSFLTNWERVKRFAGDDIEFIHRFVSDVEAGIQAIRELPGMNAIPAMTGERLAALAETWKHSIQLTPPRASLDSMEDTLHLVARRFLVERSRSVREYRTRASAAAIAKASIRDALRSYVGGPEAEMLIKPSTAIPGKRKLHVFDGVVMNGVPYFAVQGISFELPEARQLNLQIDALAWAVADVRDRETDIPIGILALPPKSDSGRNSQRLFGQSVAMYRELGADVLTEKSMNDWSVRHSQRVPKLPR